MKLILIITYGRVRKATLHAPNQQNLTQQNFLDVWEDSHILQVHKTAIHSISTNTSLGRRDTSTVALAGAVSGLKY